MQAERTAFLGETTEINPGRIKVVNESRDNTPILAPDGEHATWGEFSGAEGDIIVKCTERGTHAAVHLSGLIPKGIYSVWIDVFDVDTENSLGRFALAKTNKKGKRRRGNVLSERD